MPTPVSLVLFIGSEGSFTRSGFKGSTGRRSYGRSGGGVEYMDCVCGPSTAVARDLSSCMAPGVTDVLLRRHGRTSGCVPRGRQADGGRDGRAEGRFESWGRLSETLGNERLFRAEGRTNMMAGVSLLPVAEPPGTRGRVEEHNGGRRGEIQVIQTPRGSGISKRSQAEEGEKKKKRVETRPTFRKWLLDDAGHQSPPRQKQLSRQASTGGSSSKILPSCTDAAVG